MRNYIIKNSLNYNSSEIIVTKKVGEEKVTLHVTNNKEEAKRLVNLMLGK